MSRPPEAIPPGADGQVARRFLALGSGEAVARLVAFAATIYAARVLGPASYGAIGVATAVTLYLTHLADGGVELGIGVREVAAAPHRLAAIVPSILTARLVVSVVLALVAGAAALLLLPEPEATVVALYALTLVAVGGSGRWVHLALGRAGLVALSRAAGQFLVLGLVLLLVRGPRDVARVPLAQLAGDVAVTLLLLRRLRLDGIPLAPRLEPSVIRPLLPRSGSLVLGTMLGLMIFNADLIFLRLFRGSTETGLYTAAYTFVSFGVNLGLAYSLSLLPSLTRLGTEPAARTALYQTAVVQVFAVSLPVAVGGQLLAGPLLELVFGTRYAPAGPALALLGWSVPLSLVRDVPIIALMAIGREDKVLRVTALAAGLNLCLNLALIPRYGMAGAALATVATEAVRLVIAFRVARRLGFPVGGIPRLWRPLAAAAAMAGLLLALAPRSLPLAVALGAAAYLAALLAVGGVRLRRDGPPILTV
ncbi:MAG TPA: flippase [Gemmatimonadales bacterium]|nr:flippase [Gemmatimonadales bacterium]